jgi:hypothetical protein
MGKSSDKSAAKGAKAEPEASKMLAAEPASTSNDTPSSKPIDSSLPVVESPKLGAEEAIEPSDAEAVNEALRFDAAGTVSRAEAAQEMPREPAGETAAAAPQARSMRFAMLAATIALVAAIGSFLGSLSASGIVRLLPSETADSRPADANNALQTIKAQIAELAAIKSNLDGATRTANAQFAKIADRLDRVERAQTDPAPALAHIADTVDRLDKRNALPPETTGSITPSAPPANEPKLTDKILDGWIVQDVEGGRALVASRYHGVFDVAAGSFLPGLGRVETVKRQDGQWVVVTEHGVIPSGR